MNIYMDIFICLVGLAWHAAMKWGEYRRDVALVGLVAYLQAVPAQAAGTVLATIAAFTVSNELGWMNPGLALACGYMGSSIAENAVSRFSKVPDK